VELHEAKASSSEGQRAEIFGSQGRQSAGEMLAERHSAGRMPAECYLNACGTLAFLHSLDAREDQPLSFSIQYQLR